MKTVRTDAPQTVPPGGDLQLQFAQGLLGLPQMKRFVLRAPACDVPFCWLDLRDQPGHGFVVVAGASVVPGYAPDISQPDAEALGLGSPDDALVLNLVTVCANGQATINLRGPLVVNRHTCAAKQCVPANVSTFSLQHPVPARSAAAA
jgi:flagellar assembly factor FliW